jgi:hypothetical protein
LYLEPSLFIDAFSRIIAPAAFGVMGAAGMVLFLDIFRIDPNNFLQRGVEIADLNLILYLQDQALERLLVLFFRFEITDRIADLEHRFIHFYDP